MPTKKRKLWRELFTNTIMELAGNEVNVLDAASWAMRAQAEQGDRDPREMARDLFKQLTISLPSESEGVSRAHSVQSHR